MSEMLHPDSVTAAGAATPGADVLAAIRRLLAEDVREDDGASRHGALRRRLIGTRRPPQPVPLRAEAVADPGAVVATGDPLALHRPAALSPIGAEVVAADAEASVATGDPRDSRAATPSIPLRADGVADPEAVVALGDPWLWAAPQPLRLADAQRVAPSVSAIEAGAAPDPAQAAILTTPAEAPPPQPAASEPADAWPLAAEHPAMNLRELLTFQAWIAEDATLDSVPASQTPLSGPEVAIVPLPVALPERDASTAAPGAPGAAVAPLQPHATAALAGVDVESAPPPALALAVAAVVDAEAESASLPATATTTTAALAEVAPLLRAVIRDTMLEELAGETGAHLSAAINALTRRAVAGALADLAREMGALESADGTDLH